MKHIEHIVGYMRFKARLDNLDVRINEAEINEFAKSRDWNPYVLYVLNKGAFEPYRSSKHGLFRHYWQNPILPCIAFNSDGLPRWENTGELASETIRIYWEKHNLLELSDDTDKELYNFCPLVTYSIHKMRWSMSNYRYYLEHYP